MGRQAKPRVAVLVLRPELKKVTVIAPDLSESRRDCLKTSRTIPTPLTIYLESAGNALAPNRGSSNGSVTTSI